MKQTFTTISISIATKLKPRTLAACAHKKPIRKPALQLAATLCVSVLALSGCETLAPANQAEPYWTFPAAQGISIHDTQTGTTLKIDTFNTLLGKPDYILLGETHDNPIHHDIELAIVRQLIADGWLQQVSMEMLTPKQTDSYYAAINEDKTWQPATSEQLKKRLLWPDKGWPWNDYARIIETTLANHIPLAAANIEREEIMRIYQEGGDKTAATSSTVFSPTPEQTATLAATIEESHCGQIDTSMVPPMIAIQLAKDQAMAQSLLQVPAGALLIAGAFHVRKDLSVPQHFLATSAHKQRLVIGMLEEPLPEKGTAQELTRSELALSLTAQYDIVIFTPEHPREDPCNVFKKPPQTKQE